MIKVSIIVPVYNVEHYLATCLDSLISQTLQEIEIIVVNDGATDGSQKIIEEYSKKSIKIKAYLKDNGGLSDARNYGLSLASGEYIGYIDSDDFAELDMYEILYDKAKKENSDIVECNLRHTYLDKEDIELGKEIHDKKEMIMFGRSVVWNKVYKRDWLLETKVIFPKGLIYEDLEYYSMLVPHIRKYSYVKEASIHYVQRSSSINNSSSLKTMDIFTILKNIYNYYKENNYYQEYERALEFYFARILLCSSFARMSRIPDKKQRKMALAKNWSLLMELFPDWRKNPYLIGKKSYQAIFMKTVNTGTYQFYCFAFPIFYRISGKLKRMLK